MNTNENTNEKKPRHIPRYKNAYWRPVKSWNDGLSKPRHNRRGKVSAWTEAVLNGERERNERFFNRRITIALAIGEAVTVAAVAALWIYVCTM